VETPSKLSEIVNTSSPANSVTSDVKATDMAHVPGHNMQPPAHDNDYDHSRP